jgi:hypothetical protein
MKYIWLALLALSIATVIPGVAQAQSGVQTGPYYVYAVQVSTGPTAGVIYVRPTLTANGTQPGTWNAPGCLNAQYVYWHTDMPVSTEWLHLMQAAVLSAKKVWFYGTCDSNLNYIKINYAAITD